MIFKKLNLKSKIFLTVITFLVFSFYILSSVRADTDNSPSSFYYVFHLYYGNGQLNTDRDFQFKYDVIPDVFVQAPVGQFPYRGEVINFVDEISGDFKFDPKAGKNSVQAPYVADAQKVIFYDNQEQPVLTIPVSETSFCNDDGICNVDRGEDYLNCSKDCKNSLATPLPETAPPTPTNESSGLLSGILYTLAGIILLGLLWWMFKRRRGPSSLLPPAPPLSVNIQ